MNETGQYPEPDGNSSKARVVVGGATPEIPEDGIQLPLRLAHSEGAGDQQQVPRERRSRGEGQGVDGTAVGSAAVPLAAWVRLSPAVPTEVYDTYWRFAVERQAILFRRLNGFSQPWTADPVLRRFKFTNPYRACDRVSQFLIRHVIYSGPTEPAEVFFRTILFKLFNKIDTWKLLEEQLGDITYRSYRFELYDGVLTEASAAGNRIYSAAYIMPSGPRPSAGGATRKHRNHLRLLERMMQEDVPARIAESVSMSSAFELLRSFPSIGNFLAYQFVTDLNYSEITDFSEREFVIPGPGARDGIRKCFRSLGGLNEVEIIRVVMDRQEEEFNRLGLVFPTLWGRPLQLIDCQSLFCEVDKYARVKHPEARGASGRKRIKQQFVANPVPLKLMFPPKWGLNDRIARAPTGDQAHEIPPARAGTEGGSLASES